MKRPLRVASLLALALALGACATTGAAQPRSTGPVSCLLDPAERGTRPLILFFCIQNP
jgi:hypothetical protein